MKLPIALALLSAKASYASWDWSKFASKSTPNLPQNNRALETDVPCTHSARKIKIQSTTGEPLSFREVRVFSDEVNVAIGKTATQSSDLDDSSGASKAVDGKWRTKATTGDDEGCSTWWEVDLEESTPINKVQIVNPDKSCKLSYATISLLDADGETVWAKVVGDTCDKGSVGRKFEFECPTASPTTTSPTAAPTMPTFDPNYDCQSPDGCWEFLTGFPLDANLNTYASISSVSTTEGAPATVEECKDACPKTPTFRGLMFFDASNLGDDGFGCICHYDLGTLPPLDDIFDGVASLPGSQSGTGPVSYASGEPSFVQAGKWHPGPTAAPATTTTGTGGTVVAPTECTAPVAPGGSFVLVGGGTCENSDGLTYDIYYNNNQDTIWTPELCQAACPLTCGFRGFHVGYVEYFQEYNCNCNYDTGYAVSPPEGFNANSSEEYHGSGPITSTFGTAYQCYKYVEETPTSGTGGTVPAPTGTGGTVPAPTGTGGTVPAPTGTGGTVPAP